jgi:hypothetical protein
MEDNELLKPLSDDRLTWFTVSSSLDTRAARFQRSSKAHRYALALQASVLFTLPMFSMYKILAAVFWSVKLCTCADVPF